MLRIMLLMLALSLHGAPASHAQARPATSTPNSTPNDTPTVMIGDKDVARVVHILKQPVDAIPLPASLDTTRNRVLLKQRRKYQVYRHSPSSGPADAPFRVVEFLDLGCMPCNQLAQEFDSILASQLAPNQIQRRYVHAPSAKGSANPLASFYGKIADSVDQFWAYRDAVRTLETFNAQDYFRVLQTLGFNDLDVRQSAIKNAGRYYHELDSDTLRWRQFNLENGPMWLVNGLMIHNTALDLSLLPDVLHYEQMRLGLIAISQTAP